MWAETEPKTWLFLHKFQFIIATKKFSLQFVEEGPKSLAQFERASEQKHSMNVWNRGKYKRTETYALRVLPLTINNHLQLRLKTESFIDESKQSSSQ